MLEGLKGSLRRLGLIDRTGLKSFLRAVAGVIHVGAHQGQEASLYAQYRLRVLWIEALEEQFAALQDKLRRYPNQRALCCLVTDKDFQTYAFHIASNEGASSSILELRLHADIWPGVTVANTRMLTSKTLTSLLAEHDIDPTHYDALVMDTQGSELLVLQGSVPLLRGFRYIQTEVADFEAYRGCCQLPQIQSFLAEHGYEEHVRKIIAQHPGGGCYYDIVFAKRV